MTDTNLAVQQPGERLVLYAKKLAIDIAERPEIKAGLEAASGATGLVVTDEAGDVAANDLGATITRTSKALKKAVDEVKAHPKNMIAAIDEITKPVLAALEAGRRAVDDAQLRYKAEQRRKAAEEEARRLAAQRAAEAAERERAAKAAAEAAAAALEGREAEPEEEVPPAPVSAPVEAPRSLVRTSAGSSTTMKRLTCELVNPLDAPGRWLKLVNTTDPCAEFEDLRRRGEVDTPGVGDEKPVVYAGVKFFYQESVTRSVR